MSLIKELFIIAGANGSGKTTLAKELLPEFNLVFINADEIARELSPDQLENARIQAGKIFFNRVTNLIEKNVSFAIESTLSGKYLVRYIEDLKEAGYQITIVYVFVDNPEIAINRIKSRVKDGGHFIPNVDVIRRFKRSKSNFWYIYKNLADNWEIFYNGKDRFIQIATGEHDHYDIVDEEGFRLFMEGV